MDNFLQIVHRWEWMNHISLQEEISLNELYLLESQFITDQVKAFIWNKTPKLALEQNLNPEGRQLWIYLELLSLREGLCSEHLSLTHGNLVKYPSGVSDFQQLCTDYHLNVVSLCPDELSSSHCCNGMSLSFSLLPSGWHRYRNVCQWSKES